VRGGLRHLAGSATLESCLGRAVLAAVGCNVVGSFADFTRGALISCLATGEGRAKFRLNELSAVLFDRNRVRPTPQIKRRRCGCQL